MRHGDRGRFVVDVRGRDFRELTRLGLDSEIDGQITAVFPLDHLCLGVGDADGHHSTDHDQPLRHFHHASSCERRGQAREGELSRAVVGARRINLA